MIDFNDATDLKRSLLAVEAAIEPDSAAKAPLKAHHALLTKLANKYQPLLSGATPGRMQTLSGGTDKDDDDGEGGPGGDTPGN